MVFYSLNIVHWMPCLSWQCMRRSFGRLNWKHEKVVFALLTRSSVRFLFRCISWSNFSERERWKTLSEGFGKSFNWFPVVFSILPLIYKGYRQNSEASQFNISVVLGKCKTCSWWYIILVVTLVVLISPLCCWLSLFLRSGDDVLSWEVKKKSFMAESKLQQQF